MLKIRSAIAYSLYIAISCFGNVSAQEVIHVFMGTDSNYVKPTLVAMASMLYNLRANKDINIHMFDFGLTNEDKISLESLSWFGKPYISDYLPFTEEDARGMTIAGRWPIGVFAKYWIPYYSQKYNIDQAIWLDGDVIVEGDIEKLWNIDLRRGGGYLAGVPDHGCTACHSKCGSKYAGKVLNAGVLLFNCKAMLEDNCLEKLIQKTLEVQKNSVCVEQEAIARVAYKRQLILPKEFNIQVFHTLRNFLTDFGSRECRDANCYRSVARLTKNWRLANPVEDGLIVHFNNNYLRPWKPMSVCSPYTDLWYRYLRLTHYFDFAEILKGDLICGVASIFKRSLQLYGWIGRNLLDVRKSSISLDLINLIP